MNPGRARRTHLIILVGLAALSLAAELILNLGNSLSANMELITVPAETETAMSSTLFAQASAILSEVTATEAVAQTRTALVETYETGAPTLTRTPTPTVLTSDMAATGTAQQILFAQATAIIAGVTQTTVVNLTGTATAMGTFSTPGPSPTVTPTFTPSPIPPLAQQVGFSDPELAMLESKQINVLNESIEFTSYNHHRYRLLSIWSSRFPSAAPGGVVVLYQTDGDHPQFLWIYDKTPALTAVNISEPPPGDWNGDAHVYFALHVTTGGNGRGIHSWFEIYELNSDGTVISALKNAIAPSFLVLSIERKQYRTLLTTSNLGVTGYAEVTRYYDLVHGQVINSWNDHLSAYLARNSAAIYHATTAYVFTDNDALVFAEYLYEILETYQAIEQREAGWLLVQDLVSEAKQTNRLQERTFIDKEFMPTMARLYKENRSFVPPPVDFSRPETSYYDQDN